MPCATIEEQRRYQREWLQRRRLAWLDAHGPCAKCGSDVDMEVDHIDPALKVDHKVWSWTEERRAEELEKCQVLCGKCHDAKTAEQRRARIRHGHTHDVRRLRLSMCRMPHMEERGQLAKKVRAGNSESDGLRAPL